MGHRIGRQAGRRVAVTDAPFDVKAGRIEAGSVSAQRFSYTAVVNGRRAMTIEHVTVEGNPSMELRSAIAVRGEDETEQSCLGTVIAGRGVLSG